MYPFSCEEKHILPFPCEKNRYSLFLEIKKVYTFSVEKSRYTYFSAKKVDVPIFKRKKTCNNCIWSIKKSRLPIGPNFNAKTSIFRFFANSHPHPLKPTPWSGQSYGLIWPSQSTQWPRLPVGPNFNAKTSILNVNVIFSFFAFFRFIFIPLFQPLGVVRVK